MGTDRLWRHGKVPGFPQGEPLVMATDGSLIVKKGTMRGSKGDGGMGCVLTDGRWAMGTWKGGSQGTTGFTLQDPSGPLKTTVLELRAAFLALELAGEDAAQALLLVDDMNAVDFLRQWQRGGNRMPEGYSLRERVSGKPPRLVSLAEAVAKLPKMKIRHVKGHAGHPLNEAADSLAKLAARRPEDQKERAEGLVEAFLRQWYDDSQYPG